LKTYVYHGGQPKNPLHNEWEIWIQQGLFVLNIPDQLIIGGMDIKLSPPS